MQLSERTLIIHFLLIEHIRLEISDIIESNSHPPLIQLPLSLLTPENISEVVDDLASKNPEFQNWKMAHHFVRLLSDFGPVPRALEFILQVFFFWSTERSYQNEQALFYFAFYSSEQGLLLFSFIFPSESKYYIEQTEENGRN